MVALRRSRQNILAEWANQTMIIYIIKMCAKSGALDRNDQFRPYHR
jgi:hypothetical protein